MILVKKKALSLILKEKNSFPNENRKTYTDICIIIYNTQIIGLYCIDYYNLCVGNTILTIP